MHSQSLPKPLPEQFLQETKDAPTLWISTCDLDSGGCHEFGRCLANTLQHDYINASIDKEGILFFAKKITTSADYENVCITGCLFHKTEFLQTLIAAQNEILENQNDNFKLKNIFLVSPPHKLIDPVAYAHFNKMFSLMYLKHFSCNIQLLASSLTSEDHFSIGLPKLLPSTSSSTEQKNVLNEHTLGIIYIRDLLINDNNEEANQVFTFLERYSQKIISLANSTGITTPSVIILSPHLDTEEKLLYQAYLATSGIDLIFKTTLPSDQFHLALSEIAEKKGVLASNGVMTPLQGLLLGCDVLIHGNKNKSFLRMLSTLVPDECQSVAEEILGLSNQLESHNHPTEVSKVYAVLKENVNKSTAKFEHLKKTYLEEKTEEKALTHLKSITGLEWEYDQNKHLFFHTGDIPTNILDTLKATHISKCNETRPQLFGNLVTYIITNTPDNLKHLEEIANTYHPPSNLRT